METVHLETKVCKREEMSNIWICHRDQICWRKAYIKEMRLITVGRTFLLILLMGSVQPQRKLVLRPNSRNWSFLIINSSLPLKMTLSRWTESGSLENLFLSTSVRSWFSKMKKSFCTQMCSVLFQNAPHGCLSLLTAAMEQNFFKKKNTKKTQKLLSLQFWRNWNWLPSFLGRRDCQWVCQRKRAMGLLSAIQCSDNIHLLRHKLKISENRLYSDISSLISLPHHY